MKNLWNQNDFQLFGTDEISQRVYSSRLLGKCPELVLHGGGNTSVKGETINIFGEPVKTLFIKGSGWDLISIEKEGFAPVDLDHLKKLSKLETLSDSEMVMEQKNATLTPNAPNPSVEAILHALIPFKFVDHTHADSVLSISNTPNGIRKIKEIYEDDILIIPYVMPGFILAKKVEEYTKNINWDKIRGMILLNHGVFSFGDSAKQSYDRMINIVTLAENYLKENRVWNQFAKSNSTFCLEDLARIRKEASKMTGRPLIAIANNSKEAVGFSKLKNVKKLCSNGTLTPDHVIRTKPFAWVLESDLETSAKKFVKKYELYFKKYKTKGLKILNCGPKWALWPKYGTVSFGFTKTQAKVVFDINKHTIRAVQTSFNLDDWKPISFKDLFDIEYWELEQLKLRKNNKTPEFQGKIALVTGAASGIGKACVEKLLDNGCSVLGLDKNAKINSIFKNIENFKAVQCDLLKTTDIKKAVNSCILEYGGLDILVSNAGVFSSSKNLEDIDDNKWDKDIDVNLKTHHRILRECIPYLKLGINASIIFIGSRNVGAPGPGAGTYTIAKAGLTQMARLAAIELSKYNIRVNILHPDCVYDTDIWSKEVLKERAKKYGISVVKYKQRNLLKTDVLSSDVAELVIFFAGGRSGKTTGAQMPVDGGNNRII